MHCPCERRVLAAHHAGGTTRVRDEPCLIVAQNELTDEDERLNVERQMLCQRRWNAVDTYALGLLLWDAMARTLDEYKCPVALLMNDARELAVVIEPRRRWWPREALDATESRILDDD